MILGVVENLLISGELSSLVKLGKLLVLLQSESIIFLLVDQVVGFPALVLSRAFQLEEIASIRKQYFYLTAFLLILWPIIQLFQMQPIYFLHWL